MSLVTMEGGTYSASRISSPLSQTSCPAIMCGTWNLPRYYMPWFELEQQIRVERLQKAFSKVTLLASVMFKQQLFLLIKWPSNPLDHPYPRLLFSSHCNIVFRMPCWAASILFWSHLLVYRIALFTEQVSTICQYVDTSAIQFSYLNNWV